MELYFSPLACSLASRISVYEAGLEAETVFHNVTLSTKRYDGEGDYWQVTARGQVPALRTREGAMLNEGPAVLQYLADLAPGSGLAPAASSFERYRLQSWLNFIATELHKQVFAVEFNPSTPQAARDFALGTVAPDKLALVERELADGRTYLMGDGFTVADAYLATVLNWTRAVQMDLSAWPNLVTYFERVLARPQVARALHEELVLAGRVAA